MKQLFVAALVTLLAHALPASAIAQPSADLQPPDGVVAPSIATSDVGVPTPVGEVQRPRLLMGMYVACGLLQGYDGYSTIKSASSNHAELNPVMAGIVSHPGLVIAAKAAAAVVTIAVAENLWRTHHRRRAIGLMVVSNVLMAAVGANNTLALRTQR